MGNREDLLTAAKNCLYEKGYARTTARDIATAAGVSLAAIGYHYGTKEALLNAALHQAIEEWGDDLTRLLTQQTSADATREERFETLWTTVLQSFATTRPLWAVQFELIAHIERTPELRTVFAENNRAAQQGLVDLFGGPATAPSVGAFYQALLVGVAALSLVDPDDAPSGHDLTRALKAVAGSLTT